MPKPADPERLRLVSRLSPPGARPEPAAPPRSVRRGGRRFQFGTRAFVAPYGTFSDQRGTPTGAAAVRAALGA